MTDPNGPTEHLVGGRFDPATQAVALFPIPPGLGGTLSMSPGPDGAVWFSGVAADPTTQTDAGVIGRIDPATDAVTEFPLPRANSDPTSLTPGTDGRLWFAARVPNPDPTGPATLASDVGRFDTTTHAVDQFPLPRANATVIQVTAGPDGGMWAIDANFDTPSHRGSSSLLRIDPTTRAVAEYPVPQAVGDVAFAQDIARGSDGALWYDGFTSRSSAAVNGVVGRFDPATHGFTVLTTPPASSDPFGITLGPDGNL